MGASITKILVVRNENGLHARPAVKLSKIAKKYSSNIEIKQGDSGVWISAKSTSALIKLKARKGSVLTISAEGEDALDAIDAVTELVTNDFGE